MPAPIRYVQDSPDFPDAADVVVIGAGIAGAAATWYLAKQGLKVVLIEKGTGRGRTVQPQLGLVPPAESRRA